MPRESKTFLRENQVVLSSAAEMMFEMEDMKYARDRLVEKGLALCFVKDEQVIFETSSRGISGFLRAIEEFDEQLRGASAADKVVGKAVALLCVYTGIRAVYASVVSRKAKELFEEKNVKVEWSELVEDILNDCEPGTCPFEKLASSIEDPAEAYIKLKALQDSLEHAEKGMSTVHGGSSLVDDELKNLRHKKLSELKDRKQKAGNKPVHMTDANFSELTSKHALALVDFWAAWCGPCQSLAPTIEELAQEFEGRVFIGKLNVDENPQTAAVFQVFSIPTMVIMKTGKEVDRIVGCVQKKYIAETLDKHLKQA